MQVGPWMFVFVFVAIFGSTFCSFICISDFLDSRKEKSGKKPIWIRPYAFGKPTNHKRLYRVTKQSYSCNEVS